MDLKKPTHTHTTHIFFQCYQWNFHAMSETHEGKWIVKSYILWNPNSIIEIPVTQEIHMELGVEMAREICSGKMDETFLASLGWSMGKSSLPCRRDLSKLCVTGANGPSRVVGMFFAVTTIWQWINQNRGENKHNKGERPMNFFQLLLFFSGAAWFQKVWTLEMKIRGYLAAVRWI